MAGHFVGVNLHGKRANGKFIFKKWENEWNN